MGKGDLRRPMLITQNEFEKNWKKAFNRYDNICLVCGTEIVNKQCLCEPMKRNEDDKD